MNFVVKRGDEFITITPPDYRKSTDESIFVKVVSKDKAILVGVTQELTIIDTYFDDIDHIYSDKFEQSTEKEFQEGVSAALSSCVNFAALINPINEKKNGN